jgi:hypothetical protein
LRRNNFFIARPARKINPRLTFPADRPGMAGVR